MNDRYYEEVIELNKQLDRCPCCGSKAVFTTTRGTFNELVAENGSACVSIRCTGKYCGLSMFVHHKTTDYGKISKVGIKQWNRRFSDGKEHPAD